MNTVYNDILSIRNKILNNSTYSNMYGLKEPRYN